MFGRPTTSFDKLIEKATSQLLLDPDWNTILQICDAVRQEDVTPKAAIAIVKKKVTNDNPHVAKFALIVLESMVKNCGAPIQQEVATKEMMDFMREQILKRPEPIKSKLLELVQVWSHAFRTQPAYKIVEETYKLLKHEGHSFPVLREADAMFAAEKAPEWKDGETCHRCKDKFGTFNRKHHCRCCGDIFCNKCSSKNSIVPQFGIEREVRVCDGCFDKLNAGVGGREDEQLPAEYLASSLARQPQVSQGPPAKSERDIQQQEEEELQLAIALSQSEAEAKAKERDRGRSSRATHNTLNGHTAVSSSPQQNKFASVPAIDTTDMDPELARYLDRNYWTQRREDNKQGMQQPSAPVAQADPAAPAPVSRGPVDNSAPANEAEHNGEGGGAEDDEQFMDAVEKSIEIFVNRMKSDSLRGRSIAADSSVQTLFVTLSTMHTELLKNMHKLDDNRVYYESLQDKLAELKDAREALEVLREEHREKRRREQEEQERQRQLAMAHKLDMLRLKKQEYLEHQRQLAMQRMEEQEMEMRMRLEQQKQMQQMRQMYNNPYMQTVYGPMSMTQQYLGQPGANESSPHHYPAAPGGVQYAGTAGYMPGQPVPGYAGPQGPAGSYQPQQGPQSVGGAATFYPGGGYPGNQGPSPYLSQQQTLLPGQQPGVPTFQGGQPQVPFQGQGQGGYSQPGANSAASFQGQVPLHTTLPYAGQPGQAGPYPGQGQGQTIDGYQPYQGQLPADYQYAQQGGYQQGQGQPQPGYGGPSLTDSQLISFD